MWRVRGHDPEAAPLSRPGAPQHPLSRRRRRRRRGQLPGPGGGAGRRADLLRRQGQPGARDPGAGWPRSAARSTWRARARSRWPWPPGADPSRISYGNTIKKEADIAGAFALGVRLFAFDSEAELAKIARAAPGSRVFCRILTTRRGCRLAAVAQVRLRARHGARAADPRRRDGRGALGRVVPCRLAAEEPGRLGGGAGRGRRPVPRPRGRRHRARHGQSRRRLPHALPHRRARRRGLWLPRSWPRCAAISATASRS